jgi:hypothetical protein
MFELSGEDGIRVIDLASANGTIVNGNEIGSRPMELKAGDVIEVGSTTVNIVGEVPPVVPGNVDLGLGGGEIGAETVTMKADPEKKRSPISVVLWIVALLLASAAVYFMMMPPPETEESSPQEVREIRQVVQEVSYEKVEADSNGIFRYEMTLSSDGVLKVTIDDVPKENRHLTKSEKLSEQSLKELNEILDFDSLRKIDREYAGVESEPPKLESWNLKVVYTSRVRSVSIVNTREPEAFRAIREKLEAFSKNQLGIWAIEYSGEKLLKLAEDAISLGRMKWEDRDVQYGNLHGSIAAYREALFYLETVDPKPACYYEAKSGMERSLKELDARYTEERFLADRAINLSQWENAKRELMILLEMIPDRKDDRHREATAKLLDVEKRMKKGAK